MSAIPNEKRLELLLAAERVRAARAERMVAELGLREAREIERTAVIEQQALEAQVSADLGLAEGRKIDPVTGEVAGDAA